MLSSLTRRWVALLIALVSSMVFVAGCEGDDDGGFKLAIDAAVFDVSNDQIGSIIEAGADTSIILPTDAGKDGDAEAGVQVFGVGGTVTGLAGASGLVLQLNGANNLTIIGDGAFAFPVPLTNGSSYNVTIATQPTGRTCSVSAGSGTIQNALVTGIVVNCAANTFTIGGNITGLAAGASVTLQNNAGNNLVRNANGAFAFTTPIATGAAYAVTVSVQPSTPAQVCTVTNGSGTVANANVTNVTVTCVTSSFTVGGSVTGLAAGASVVLQNNAGDNLTVNANGAFTFATSVASGAAYAVTVLTNPSNPAQTCTVTSGSGNIAAANVTNVAVACTTTSFTVGGTLAGLTNGNTIVLRNNGGDNLTLNANGAFTFATSVASGAPYSVTIFTQPANQACTVSAGSGNVSNGNVTTVNVNCGNTYTIGGSVTGLGAGTLILNNNGAFDTVNVTGNGNFAFPQPLVDGAAYAVTIGTQPSNPTQTCIITGGSGNVAAANVTNIAVSCTTNVYQVGGVISGLAAGETAQLQNNGGDTITVAANGNFVFPTDVPSGTTYAVTVSQNPSEPIRQTCVATSATGTVGAGNVTNVQVTCTTDTFFVGGNLTGLALGATVVLQNNGADNLTLSNNGAFQFATRIASGATYTATVLNNPTIPSQSCVIDAQTGTGTVGGANVTSIGVTCTTNSFTVGGSVIGLDTSNENSVTIQNNGGDDITLNGNTTFTFATPVASGSSYAVTVSANPTSPAQTCTVNAGSGTMGGGNVTGVVINCATNLYTVGGTVSGLAAGNTVVLRNNGGNDLSVGNNGPFAFSTPIASGTGYTVSVFTSPTAPVSQSCNVTGGATGTVGGGPVTNVQVTCTTNAFTVGGSLTGLAPGNTLTIRNNGGDDVNMENNGTFTFQTSIPSGNTFNITVAANPDRPIQQTCAVTGGAGTVGSANYASASIVCTTVPYRVGGTVFGLTQGQIVLQLNGGNNLTMTANGSFTFTQTVNNGSPYAVTIFTQPNVQEQICQVVDGGGTMPTNDVTNVRVYCGWTCNSIHLAQPALPSGPYTIDPDGSGPIFQFTARCDMTYLGGGWTLAQATNDGAGPTQGTAGLVVPGSTTYMPVNTVSSLANLSQQIHIRTPDPQTPFSLFVTSVAGSPPITNLRSGRILNFGEFGFGPTYVGRTYWTVSGTPPTNDLSMFDTQCASLAPFESWPNVFYACGSQTTGFSLYGTESAWQVQDEGEYPMEVWVR